MGIIKMLHSINETEITLKIDKNADVALKNLS